MLVQSKHLALLLFFFSLTEIVFVLVTCSPGCVLCTNDTCVACTQGSYLESGSCHSCPAHCTSCNNSMVCYNCTEGYYGLSCEKNCISSMCLNNTCSKDSGACLHGCIDGHYLYGSSCYPCASNCKTCANFSNNCLECKDGYYGPSCQYPCSRCKDGICTSDNCTYGCRDGFYRGTIVCNPCNKNCRRCSIKFDNCHACVDGYFGSACAFNCSDCSPCNQDGSCPKTTLQPTVPATTSSLPSTSQSARPTCIESTTLQSYPPTTRDSNNEERYEQKQPMDNTIKYAIGGVVGGFLVFVVVVVFVTKRWSRIKQTNVRINSQLTERDGALDYTTLEMSTRKEDDLDSTNRTATMETMSSIYDSSGKMTQHALPQKQIGDTEPRIYINVT